MKPWLEMFCNANGRMKTLMKTKVHAPTLPSRSKALLRPGVKRLTGQILLSAGLLVLAGCAGGPGAEEDRFFTSGSREADQRAAQRIAKHEQLESGGDADTVDNRKRGRGAPGIPGATEEGKLTLYERLGGEQGIVAITDDFTQRVLEDPRVNWQRKGVDRGGWFRRSSPNAVMWTATSENVATLKRHLAQFFSLATGGPPNYEGKNIRAAHADMRITNPEFDAVVGDLKASLDKLQVAQQEQKELLAIVESTRPQVVTER